MSETIYLASWTQRFVHPFTRESGEHRLTQHVGAAELARLRDDKFVVDLRSVEVPSLTAKIPPERMRWLRGGSR